MKFQDALMDKKANGGAKKETFIDEDDEEEGNDLESINTEALMGFLKKSSTKDSSVRAAGKVQHVPSEAVN